MFCLSLRERWHCASNDGEGKGCSFLSECPELHCQHTQGDLGVHLCAQPLDRRIGEPVEIMVNGRVIGRGEITVLEGDDTRFGVKLIEIKGNKKS